MSDRSRFSEGNGAVTIRRARPEDRSALVWLAVLDDALPLEGDVLLAEVDGVVWAARSLADGRVISDPFRPAAEARALLELRARLLADAAARRRTRGRLLPAFGLSRDR
jgi:hypothetical protein